ARLQARGQEVAGVAAEHAHRAGTREQVALELAVEAAEPGLPQRVGAAVGHAGVEQGLGLAVLAAVAAAAAAAVGVGLAEGEAGDGVAYARVAPDHPAVHRLLAAGEAAVAAAAELARPRRLAPDGTRRIDELRGQRAPVHVDRVEGRRRGHRVQLAGQARQRSAGDITGAYALELARRADESLGNRPASHFPLAVDF